MRIARADSESVAGGRAGGGGEEPAGSGLSGDSSLHDHRPTLTAADTVIRYDPWWHPAVERQAMDRVHRIGQKRGTFVFRLVAEGAVEEAILALQEKKQALADTLFEGEAAGPLSLGEEDLVTLFRPIGP